MTRTEAAVIARKASNKRVWAAREQKAKDMGFATEKEMYQHYLNAGLSIKKIAEKCDGKQQCG